IEGSEECNICLDACPMHNRISEEGIGKILGVYNARAKDPDILERCQDGGACTAFLESLEDFVSLGVTMRGGMPQPVIDAPRTFSGTKYGATSSLSFITKGMRDLAFVGLPCQITGIELARRKGLLTEVGLKVGLFCTSNFYHDSFNGVLEGRGIDVPGIRKLEIKSRLRVTQENGEVRALPLSLFDDCVLDGCRTCLDFTSFYSDISFGSAGTKDGRTTVIVRSEEADKLFGEALRKGFIEADRKVDLKQIMELQERKRRENG
ncbi:MAG: Coenzyme F420 hydrogenase/dehydrogenase, beta subunit C-terminal domain, partial [Candidatus Methanofastidiosa archaeon]|nr:Coenzyme F420 hydrogenase/dehydrogenase, beta subunit C-terminal domain [Candidatus Methanofastidiosa archaeon]